jgi:hypothetical protein
MIGIKNLRFMMLGSLLTLVVVVVGFSLLNRADEGSEVGIVAAAGLDTEPAPTLMPDTNGETGARVAAQTNILPAAVLTRTHSVSVGGFLLDTDETDIVMSTDFALVWAANSTDEAGFYMQRPVDWDRVSPIKVKIFFALGGNGAGTINWRLKLNTYTPNSGEWLTNPGSRDADAIVNFASGPSWYRIYSQSFTLQPADFNNESLWSIFFVRGNATNGETFAGNLYVLHSEVEYQAVSPFETLYMPAIER